MNKQKEYKEVNGTYYDARTNDEVIQVLENARRNDWRIRIFYGDTETGRCWNDEHDIIGYIGRSSGNIKIPLLINNKRSYGGGALLDYCIVRITVDKIDYYTHPNFYIGNMTIKEINDDSKYKAAVYSDETNIANFQTKERAENYIKFLNGERNKI